MGLGDIAVATLRKKIESGNTLDFFSCVRHALKVKNRDYLMIGKSALNREIDFLNTINGEGIEKTRFGQVEDYKDSEDGILKTIGVSISAILCALSGVGSAYLIFKAGQSSGMAEGRMRERANRYRDNRKGAKVDRSCTSEELDKKLNENKVVLSLGAGGIRGKFIPGKFTCYEIIYPSFKFANKDAKISFLEKMRDCPTIVNSMFCFMGSSWEYRKFIKRLGLSSGTSIESPLLPN